MIWVLIGACVAATVPAGLRWLRVAQREHYLPPAVATFAGRWWTSQPVNVALLAAMMIGLVGSWWNPWWGLLVPAAQIGPIGLSIKGRTSPLSWTGRMRRLAIVAGTLLAALYGFGAAFDSAFFVAVGLFLLPAVIDLALVLLGPVERWLGEKWVVKAADRLSSSGAKVVAITGSYGKTTTKHYAAHILSEAFRTVASPASFNNRMGLARAINDHLGPGSEVFVAEMGTYGPGEIADLCQWVKPDVSAIVAIGPVHLERFKSEENILAAKSEILEGADVGVIAIDHPLLQGLAKSKAEAAMELVTVSAGRADATIKVEDGHLLVDGRPLGPIPDGVFAVNLGVAVGIARALGMSPDQIMPRLRNLPHPEHRQTVATSDRGVAIIDDTYNSNPAGARKALDTLTQIGAGGRKVVVTPGMVELG
ncbi:MAG TPA: UDP-N-acetylmuramoyl-tripeptide--D-alanyl-D-alanine ligase, partial [Acidimicrobiia bacterium]|nr:UDP-N-acetylmuramoyl-tripeptide--D-alanyl-D-alanine ligase [Acidimicrobiia bacterium]